MSTAAVVEGLWSVRTTKRSFNATTLPVARGRKMMKPVFKLLPLRLVRSGMVKESNAIKKDAHGIACLEPVRESGTSR